MQNVPELIPPDCDEGEILVIGGIQQLNHIYLRCNISAVRQLAKDHPMDSDILRSSASGELNNIVPGPLKLGCVDATLHEGTVD